MFRGVCSVVQSCPALCDPLEYSLPGSSVCWIFQATTLEWVAISFYRGSSRPRNQTRVSCIAGGFFTAEPSRRPYSTLDLNQEAEKRSFGQNIPIRDTLRHLYVKGSQILWGCVCVCVCVHARVHACFGFSRSPCLHSREEAGSLDLRAWVVQNLAPSSTPAMAGRPALWTLKNLWACSPHRALRVALEIAGPKNADERRNGSRRLLRFLAR